MAAVASAILKVFSLGFVWSTADPFLFCVHHLDNFPAGDAQGRPPRAALAGRSIGNDFQLKDGWRMYHGSKMPGFPQHPHRGFETITVVRRGLVDHFDSMGATGRYGNGDVQWMTAGAGVQHAEMFPLVNQDAPNTMQLFQIWINLPAAKKMVPPAFKMFWSENIPVARYTDGAGLTTTVEVIAGPLDDCVPLAPPPDSWASDANNHVALWHIEMPAGATWTLPAAAAGLKRTLFFYKGRTLTADGKEFQPDTGLILTPDVPLQLHNGAEPAGLLVLQGRPIAEPVAQRGPFVMNTNAEIATAYSDYARTEFGGWPWPASDPAHPITTGRFARFPDGHEETPPAAGK